MDEKTRELYAYRAHAIATWVEMRSGDVDRSNAHTELSEQIVERWNSRGHARDILLPLLDDSVMDVRYAAAASLLHLGETDRAVPVLEELSQANTPDGLIPSDAQALLMHFRKSSVRDSAGN